ncbi:MAG: hypothetical protein HY517_00305 [Candidatus Aenigmarchaeota archaeon]|nr:hypothetical protein [Candidatus Aenigmarchaeota archaeon]
MDLPINIIIFIGVGVLVLVSLTGFFFGFFSDSSVDNKKLFAQGCASLRSFHDCDHAQINSITMEGVSLGYVCGRGGFTNTADCAKACGCSVGEGEFGQSLSTGSNVRLYYIPS